MAKAGIREKVAMSLSGHRTRSAFDRYHIVSEENEVEASEQLFNYLAEQSKAAKVVPLRKAGKKPSHGHKATTLTHTTRKCL